MSKRKFSNKEITKLKLPVKTSAGSNNLVDFEEVESEAKPLTGTNLNESQYAIANKVNELVQWYSVAEDRTIQVSSDFTMSSDDETILISLSKSAVDYLGFVSDDNLKSGKFGDFPDTFNITDRSNTTAQPIVASTILAGQRFSVTNAQFGLGSTWTRTTNPYQAGEEIFVVTEDNTTAFVRETEYALYKNNIDTVLIDHEARIADVETIIPNTLRVDGTRITRTQDIYSKQEVNAITNPIDNKTNDNRTIIDKHTTDITNIKNAVNSNAFSIGDLSMQTTLNTNSLNDVVPKVEKNIVDILDAAGRLTKAEADIIKNNSDISANKIQLTTNASNIKTNTDTLGATATSGTVLYRVDQLEKALQGGGSIVTAIKKYASNVGLPKESGWTASKAVFNLANLINNNDGTKPVFDFTDENIFDVKIRFTIGNPALSEKRNILFSINTGDDEPTILTFNDRAGSNANTGVILKAQLTTTGTLTVEVVSVDGTAPAFSVINFADLVVTQIQEFTISPYSSLVKQGELSTTNGNVSKNAADIAAFKTSVSLKADTTTVDANKQAFDNYKSSNDIAVAANTTAVGLRVLTSDFTNFQTTNTNAINLKADATTVTANKTEFDNYKSSNDATVSALAKKLTPAVTGVGEELLKELETKLGI